MRKRKKFDEGELGSHIIALGLLFFAYGILLLLLLEWKE